MKKRIRWGVLSTAKIATQKVIPAIQQSTYGTVTAIASRNPDHAALVARQLNIPKSYGSYEELLADPEIDAIYNPLPNHLHVPFSTKALHAGKHVLCEKPIGLSSKEGNELLALSKKFPALKVMEAFMYKFHPQWIKSKQLVSQGKIGTLKTIQSFFSYFNDDPGNIRNNPDIGGGGLMDIGCYCISLSRFIFDREPLRAIGLIEYDEILKTDRIASGILDFGSGSSTFTCSTQLVPYQRVNMYGTTGRVEIEIPFNAPADTPCKIWHTSAEGVTEFHFEVCNQYTLQADSFAKAILENNTLPTSLVDAIKNMEVIEALKESTKRNHWINVESTR